MIILLCIILTIAVGYAVAQLKPQIKVYKLLAIMCVTFALTYLTPVLYYGYMTDNTFVGKLVLMETPNEAGQGNRVHMMYFRDVDGGRHVVQNDDSWLRLKWNSKDFRASEIGKCYIVHTQGYRVGIFNVQPNILDLSPCPTQPVFAE